MTRHIDNTSRPKHAASQDALEVMIRDLRTTIRANEPINTVQRSNAVSVIHNARRDVERCSTPFDELIKSHGICDEFWPNHIELTSWLTQLSMDLIKIDIKESGLGYPEQKPVSGPIDEVRLDEGLRLVRLLDECREQLRFER